MKSSGFIRGDLTLEAFPKRLLAALLLIGILLFFFAEVFAEEADSPVSLQKDGDWYLIEFPGQLWEMEKDMSAGYRLVNDLDLHGYEGGLRPIGRPPVGNIEPFRGHFDGNNYTISGLKITNDSLSNSGLFAEIDRAGKIENLTIEDATVRGKENVGILAGVCRGTVYRVKSSGEVYGAKVVGGLIGLLDMGTIEKSSSSAEVSGGDALGGLVGLSESGEINSSFAEGDVYNQSGFDPPGARGLGGLVGQAVDANQIDQVYATGNVNGFYGSRAGGLFGSIYSLDESSAVSNAFASGTVRGTYVGGLIGSTNGSVEIKHCLALGEVTGPYRGGMVGTSSKQTNFISSYYDYQTTGVNRTIGDGIPKSTAQLQSIETYEGWSIRRSFPRHEDNYHYPRLCFSIPDCPPSDSLWVINEKAPSQSNNYTGWAIGHRETAENTNAAAIFHTSDGGETWVEQGDPTLLGGMVGNDITAADALTAWAAVGGETSGKILYTNNGGENWVVQKEFEVAVKQVRALSNLVAWAATINGQVYRTTDGGENWVSISTGDISIDLVNRLDAVGNSVWIADAMKELDFELAGKIVYSNDFGETWQVNELKDDEGEVLEAFNVGAYSEQIVWFGMRPDAILFRSDDGGKNIRVVGERFGSGDLDDFSAPDENILWLVQNISHELGYIYRVELLPGGEEVEITQMDVNYPYTYEGVSCFSSDVVWVAGMNPYEPDQKGIILHTSDGGENWTSQELPANDVNLWKISFVKEPHLDNGADLSNLDLREGVLAPLFTPGTTSYSTTVSRDISSVNITATLADENATFTINGAAATSGVARNVNLGAAGTSTPVTIVVTSADGTTEKTYSVNVNRAGTTTTAIPIYIFYENEDDVLVRADYQQAVNDLFKPNPDRSLTVAIRNKLDRASQNQKAIYVFDESGRYLDYARAIRDGLTYIEAYDSSDYWVEAQTPVKELVIDPQTGEPEEREL